MVRIGTWNTEWAKPGTAKGNRVRPLLADPDCDILCVTEGYEDIFPNGGHVIDGGIDHANGEMGERREVLLWSKRPWSRIDQVGSDRLPGGRFVAGTTQSEVGPFNVVGVCIPWFDANVRVGRKDSRRWQEHERWLREFQVLRYRQATERTIVMGDFNQRIPRVWAPKRMYELLRRAFASFTIVTAGEIAGAPEQAIDHIAHTPDMALNGALGIWPRRNEQDQRLSDHFGVWGDFKVLSTSSMSK